MTIKVPDHVKRLFIITGEASGDQMARKVIASLKGRNILIQGIGNEWVKEAGIESLFPMRDLSIMGIAEIIPQIPKMLNRINKTYDAITHFNPDLILTFDSPDFCFRVGKKIKAYKERNEIHRTLIHHHVVAPTVWAWRPGRARKIAQFLDHLYCLFPFEPAYFKNVDLDATYIEHPFLKDYVPLKSSRAWLEKQDFYIDQKLTKDHKIIGIFPGSRRGEVRRMLPTLLKAMVEMRRHVRKSRKPKEPVFVLLTLPHLRAMVELLIAKNTPDLQVQIIDDSEQKVNVITSCDGAIATSGTIGFELSLANVPHIIGYTMNNISWGLAKILVKTPYAHLTNIHLKAEAVPEFIQYECEPSKMSEALYGLAYDDRKTMEQREHFDALRTMLANA